MALLSTYPMHPGQYFLWNADIAALHPSLAHTATRVLVTGLETRGDEPLVCYAVDGDPVLLTHCTLGQFLAACSPDPAPCWAPADEVQAAIAYTAQALEEAPAPGDYAFSPERRAGVQATAAE